MPHDASRSLPRKEMRPAWRAAVLAYRANIRADGDRVARTKAVTAFRQVLPQMPEAEAEWETTQAIEYAAAHRTSWWKGGVIASPRFIRPCIPTAAKAPPKGHQWLHEPKLDGWRIQIVKAGRRVRLYSRAGSELTKRLGRLASDLLTLPARSVVIDGELVLTDESGAPNFYALQSVLNQRRDAPFSIFAFDLLHRNGVDLLDIPLVERKKRLAAVISHAVPTVEFVEAYDDGAPLLATCAKLNLEGVVSKRRDALYRSGPSRDWMKVKTELWRETNRERWRLFET